MSIYLHLVQFKTGKEVGGSWCRILGFAVFLVHCRVEVFSDIVESPVVYSDVLDAQPTICMQWPKL